METAIQILQSRITFLQGGMKVSRASSDKKAEQVWCNALAEAETILGLLEAAHAVAPVLARQRSTESENA